MSLLAMLVGPPGDVAVPDGAPSPQREGRVPGRTSSLRRVLTEAALFALGVLAYFGVRGLTETDVGTAREHAAQIVGLERHLGIFLEPSAQALITGDHALVTLFNWIYIWGHWPVIITTALWLAVRHPDGYRFLRNAMLLSGLVGIVVFVSYPVAPPRLAGLGLLDTVTLHSDSYRVLQPPALVNQYAAMPSLHVGWDLLVGLTIFRVARGRPVLRAVGIAMPILMALAVVLTGNHYLLDVVAGVTIASLGAWATYRFSTSRPERAVTASRGIEPIGGRIPAPRRPLTDTFDLAPISTARAAARNGSGHAHDTGAGHRSGHGGAGRDRDEDDLPPLEARSRRPADACCLR